MAIASPRPTAAPDPQVVAERLRERQYGGQTCGWIDANFASPITCAVGLTCAYNAVDSVRWCCEDPDLCEIPTACLNAASVTADCGDICLENSYILKCTTAGYPFCYTRFWNEGSILSELGCVAFPQSLTQTAETTYIGEVPITPTVALTTPSPNPISQSSTSSSSRSSSSTSSSSTPPSSTSPSTVSTSPESTGGDLALGIAAIVGIVIGVIFFCVILCGAGFFCWRAAKRRRNRRPQPPATTFPIDTSQVPPVYNTYNQPPATTVPIDTSQVPPVYNVSNISPIKPTTVVSETETPELSPENSVSQTASPAVVTQPETAVEPPAPPHRIDDGVPSQPSGYEDLFPEDLDRGNIVAF